MRRGRGGPAYVGRALGATRVGGVEVVKLGVLDRMIHEKSINLKRILLYQGSYWYRGSSALHTGLLVLEYSSTVLR